MPQIYKGLAGKIDRYVVAKCFKIYHQNYEIEPIDVPILGEGLVAVEDPEISGPIRVMLEHASCIDDPEEQRSFILNSLQESYEYMLETGEWVFRCPVGYCGNYGYAAFAAGIDGAQGAVAAVC